MNEVYKSVGESWHIILPAVLTSLELLGIASACHAVNKVRTSQAAVAWAVGLVTLPIVTVPLYWIAGRNRFNGYREAIRQVEQQHQASGASVCHELQTAVNAGDSKNGSSLARLADVLDTPLSVGNKFRLLVDGRQFFDELFRQIAAAETYIYAEFYIIRDDEIGRQFAAALCEQARAGKTVRLLYDEVGCVNLPNAYLSRLRESGVDVRAFNTQQGWTNRFQLNFRNHRKLLVVDGRHALVGGLNIGDEYLGHVSWAAGWRDTAISIEGPVARKLQAVFASDYYWAGRADLPEAVWSADQQDDCSVSVNNGLEACDGTAVVCATGPADLRNRATMMFATVANAAQQRLWISSPYLVPNDTCINALSMARARGVDVRILIPSQADQWLVFLAGHYYEQLLESIGISVFRYCDKFLHQKCVLVDDDLVLVGSTNLDNRSLHLNFELMLAASNPDLVRQVADMLTQDFAVSRQRHPHEDRFLPWYIRAGTVVARLFSPVL